VDRRFQQRSRSRQRAAPSGANGIAVHNIGTGSSSGSANGRSAKGARV
jgi:hypothetical protein